MKSLSPRRLALLLTLFIFLSCSVPLSTTQSPQHIKISELPFLKFINRFPSGPKFYRLDLSHIPKDLSLSISLIPTGRNKAHSVFISKSQEFPQSSDQADYSSTLSTGNVLLINNQEISSPLYFGLICPDSDCNGDFWVEWAKEIHAVANEEKVVESSNNLNRVIFAVVRLTIPKEDDIERIVIHVDVITGSKKELPSLADLFINQGVNIPFANHAEKIERKGAWFEGNTIVIQKSSSLFCTDCVFTLSLRFTEFPSISVQAQTFKENTKISGKAELDGIEKEKSNSYTFMGTDAKKEEDLIFSMKVHQGKVKIYIDCNTEPQPSRDYHWSYIAESSKEIVLTKEERARCAKENYNLLVYGEESSVYSLRASYEKSNKLLMGMGKIVPITSEILPQKITYEILIPIFAAEEVVLDVGYKQPLDVNIINCRFAIDCPGLLPANRHYQISNFHGFDDHLSIDKSTAFKHEEIPSGDGLRIKINPQESGCYPILVQEKTLIKEPVPVCAYSVTFSNQQSSPVEFTLTAEYKGPNLLSIGEPKFDIVGKNNINYYVLYVPYHEDIESVQIQLTKFSGDVNIFISKTNKYPNSQDPTTKFQFSHEGFILFKGLPETSEAYYIGIHGLEASSFSLSAIVGTQFGNNEDSAWTLNHGKPQKGTLVPKFGYHIQYYKFVLSQDNDWTGSLHISVNPLFGRVLIIVNNNGEFPTGHDHLWKAKGHELEIHSNDFEFKKQALYYVAVISDPTAPNANLLPDLVYYITWSLTLEGAKLPVEW